MVKRGWMYRPVTWQRSGLVLLVGLFSVTAFIAVDGHSHTAGDMLYGVFAFAVPSLLLRNCVASKMS